MFGKKKTKIADIIIHLKHLIKIGGENVAAIGTDYDGIECEMFLKNCGEMQIFVDALIKEFGINLSEKICHKNCIAELLNSKPVFMADKLDDLTETGAKYIKHRIKLYGVLEVLTKSIIYIVFYVSYI